MAHNFELLNLSYSSTFVAMIQIPAQSIESVFDAMQSHDEMALDARMDAFMQEQPEVVNYVVSHANGADFDAEQVGDVLIAVMMLYTAARETVGELPMVSEPVLLIAQEEVVTNAEDSDIEELVEILSENWQQNALIEAAADLMDDIETYRSQENCDTAFGIVCSTIGAMIRAEEDLHDAPE